jgi:hypothetical protein
MSGNLGWYQKIVELAKKAGGPRRLLAYTVIGGYVVIRTAEAGGKWVFEVIRSGSSPCPTKGKVFQVTSDREDGTLAFRVGDEYRVLECDGDAILIELLGNPDNPHFVSSEFLRSMSSFPPDDKPR